MSALAEIVSKPCWFIEEGEPHVAVVKRRIVGKRTLFRCIECGAEWSMPEKEKKWLITHTRKKGRKDKQPPQDDSPSPGGFSL